MSETILTRGKLPPVTTAIFPAKFCPLLLLICFSSFVFCYFFLC